MCNLCVVRVTLPRVDHGSAVSLGKNQNAPSNFAEIKFLTIDPTKKWCVGKRCVSIRRITSRSPIFDTRNIHRSAVGIVLKNDDFRDATPPVFTAAVDIFGITWYVGKVFKFLIATVFLDICWTFLAHGRPQFHGQLSIWIFFVTKGDVYKKHAQLCVD